MRVRGGAGVPVMSLLAALAPSPATGQGPTPTPVDAVYYDGFERTRLDAWTARALLPPGHSWGVFSEITPAPCHEERAMGTGGDGGRHFPSEHSCAMTPPWAIPQDSRHTFSVHHWYHLEAGVSGGRIEATTDSGRSWTVVEPEGGYGGRIVREGNSAGWKKGTRCFTGGPEGWHEIVLPLADFAGKVLRLQFVLSAGPGTPLPGWYLDEAKIR